MWDIKLIMKLQLKQSDTGVRHPQWLSGKEYSGNAGDMGLTPKSGSSPGGGHSNPLQYSCLENPTDRGAWWVTVHMVAKNWAWREWLNTHMTLGYIQKIFRMEWKKLHIKTGRKFLSWTDYIKTFDMSI